tara:strand:+ start:1980 stop:3059 length:1080 start_codon:yes stop_codon:yes gene_type:complete
MAVFGAINKPKSYYDTKLYTGTGSSLNNTGLAFQPDLVWIKKRTTDSHALTDSVRGVNKTLFTDNNNAEDSTTNMMTAFNSDGFTVGTNSMVNGSGGTYVSWNWKAGTTSGIATNGSTTITPSTYSINTTSGFSILKYGGNGNNGDKLAHGLGAAPQFFIVKRYDSAANWQVYHQATGATKYQELDTTDAFATSTDRWYDTAPDDVNITLGGSSLVNTGAGTYLVYAFKTVPGFSAFGRYNGNGTSHGAKVHTGFRPAFVMIRYSGGSNGWNWIIYNNKSGEDASNGFAYNNLGQILEADTTDGDNADSNFTFNFLSNGFRCRGTESNINSDNTNYVYAAFAENPFVANSGSGIPALAV